MMKQHKITILGFDSGLNEVLNGVHYDYRTKRIVNPVKKHNDELIIKQLRFKLKDKITTPIVIHYRIYAKDKRRDRMNIASAFDKSFEDALQKAGMIANDNWVSVYGATFEFHIDKENPRVEVEIEEVEDEIHKKL